jgi:alpha-glucosidase (family GH31 glycosyl hydrolase)
LDAKFTRRTVIHGLAGGAGTLLFRRRLAASESWVSSFADKTGPPAQELTLRAVSNNILRITVAAEGEPFTEMYGDGSLSTASPSEPILRAVATGSEETIDLNGRRIQVSVNPFRVRVQDAAGRAIQELRFESSPARISFLCGNAPIFGLGPGARQLDRRGTTDAMESGQLGEDLAIYGAHVPIPWLMSPEGWGLFFHEPWGRFDLREDPAIFHPEESARGLDVFLLAGDTAAHVLQQWSELTGYPHLPPLWALGYQQSHRTLASREEILSEAKIFREKKLPCDALIYLGTGFCPSGWNTGHGSFTFNNAVFPDSEAMIRELHQEGFKVVLHVVNPPVNLHGSVADTGSAAQDPSDAAAYWQWHVPLDHMGVDGWWPDEGDPLPKSARLTRNRMYWEGEQQVRPNLRPYALHRNGYAGIQRYGWLWSGDVLSTWKTLAAQVMQGINVGLSGIPYWGTDTGGFVPTKEFTAELFVRWFQFSAFCPLFRGHGRTWKLRLPWGWNTGDYGPAELSPETAALILPRPEDLHNASVERICGKYLNLRYRLLPYLYSAVQLTHSTGIPLMRPLWLHEPSNETARSCADQYFFGPSLLIAPVLEPGARDRQVYLPKGLWWDMWTGEQQPGDQTIRRAVDLETLPIYVKAGAILPTGPIKQFTAEPASEALTLTIYAGSDGEFFLYEDDGVSFRYEQGEFIRTELRWTESTRTLLLKANRSIPERKLRIGLVNRPPKEITFTGQEKRLSFD